jgi:hypothetical protein
MLHYFIFKHLVNIKIYKEIEIKAQQTAAQSLFIEKQQHLAVNLRKLLKYSPNRNLIT